MTADTQINDINWLNDQYQKTPSNNSATPTNQATRKPQQQPTTVIPTTVSQKQQKRNTDFLATSIEKVRIYLCLGDGSCRASMDQICPFIILQDSQEETFFLELTSTIFDNILTFNKISKTREAKKVNISFLQNIFMKGKIALSPRF